MDITLAPRFYNRLTGNIYDLVERPMRSMLREIDDSRHGLWHALPKKIHLREYQFEDRLKDGLCLKGKLNE